MDRDLRRQIKRKSDAFEESFAGTGVKLLRFSYYPEREKKYVLIVSYHGATHSFAADGDGMGSCTTDTRSSRSPLKTTILFSRP